VSAALHRHDLGLSWVFDDPLERACHALADGGRVWLIDPAQDDAALAAAAELGEPAAVIQLLDRHGRDCKAIAQRLGVPRLKLPREVPDSPFEAISVLDVPPWHEAALWWPARNALVVAELVGTSRHITLDAAPAGIHPMLRLFPPGKLRGYAPEHLLPGHGAPLHGPDAAAALEEAYARSRRDIPRLGLALPRIGRAANQAWRP
jgi:hypothetical protein